MSKFIIEGGHPLRGTITASGNKNAALKLIPACILTDQPIVLHNCIVNGSSSFWQVPSLGQ